MQAVTYVDKQAKCVYPFRMEKREGIPTYKAVHLILKRKTVRDTLGERGGCAYRT